ncbi:trypsin-like peptidase domain-containing protein [Patescibacteria group bacterium]|jgi:hypothetical protein|nr:trypsin-like peptidase domain-containing protein [Patescibacteria group bacterium]MBP7841885.1 trypsin-like peptidase domain-containing protein [Patescibacteria group bacterium]
MQNTSPDEPMSRREAALLMDKYTDKLLGTPKTTDTCQFYDLTISEGIKQAIIASCQKGIFKGKNGFFRPYDMMTRGQLIIVVARLLSGNPALELDEAYTYLLREKIIKIDDRNNASRLINKSELYIVLSRNIYGAANQNMGDPLNQIFKIKSYQKNYLFGTIENIAHGSAVLIDDNTLLTNAHVVVDEYQNPTGMYEICRSLTMNTDPICFTYADLIYYDLENDLALLSLPDDVDLSNPITLATSTARENDQVTTYGYPRDGGDTITSAKGVVSGYEKGMIKTDAAINFGNSGGGAYDKYGRLMGIPTQVAENIGYLIPVDKIQTFLDKE